MESTASVPGPAGVEVGAEPLLPIDAPAAASTHHDREMVQWALLIAAGWLGTNLGLNVTALPLKFTLKDQLGLNAAAVASFLAIGQFTNYIKPIAGLCTDSFPLWGTRRRWYLLLSLLGTGLFWFLMPLVPRQYGWMLLTYTVLYMTVVFTSTTLGGVMVEVGNRFGAAGRFTAQRIGMFRLGELGGNWLGGLLADRVPFLISAGVGGLLHLLLVPLYWVKLKETGAPARPNLRVWDEAGAQFRAMLHCRTLLAAAGMIFLIAASPGFNTPLLFFQADTLHFSKSYIGFLDMVKAATGFLGATFYFFACRRVNLRLILGWSILVHAAGTMTFFWYHSPQSALVVTAIYGITFTLSMLPVYDLATRATPRGSEALGYSVMMSVWNFTNALSDWSGSSLNSYLHLTFEHLILINAGTTLLVLFAVPFLPAALAGRKDG